MIFKLSFFILILLSTNSFAIKVLVTKSAIGYEQRVQASNLRLVNVENLRKICVPLKLKEIQNNEYISTHYINKGSILCKRDVKDYAKQSVLFNFGSLEIERKGKLIYENDEFIRIRKEDGKIEKIYKDGRSE